MTKPPLKAFLEHMLESIALIEQFTEGLSKEDFFANIEKQDAVIRRFEVIGEATRNVPDELRKQYQDIPWQDIADMRNKLIHVYFEVDVQVVWDTLKKDLIPLKKEVHKALMDLS